MKTLERLGGNFLCSSNRCGPRLPHVAWMVAPALTPRPARETMMYQGSVFTSHLEAAVELLGEVILKPGLTPEEVQETVMLTGFEHEELTDKPEIFIPQLLHKVCAARRGSAGG